MAIEETIGTARLDLWVNTDAFDAAISHGESGMKGFSATAQQAFQQADAAAKRSTTNVSRYAELIGKSADQVQLLRAAWQGVDKGTLAELETRINDARSATEKATLAAKMHAQAERETAAAIQTLNAAIAANASRAQAANAATTQSLMRERAELEQLVAARQRDLISLQASNTERAQAANAASTQALLRERAALEATVAARNNFLATLERQAATIGKTNSELMQMKAAEMGVSAQAAPFIAALQKQEHALQRAGTQFNKYGLSAKMELAALRQVPAQLTDIFVSLQGGQAPLTVLLQQGGQLRDVFGGFKPALEAIGRAAFKLVNGYTLLAGAVGVLGYAYYTHEKRIESFNRALILSGRYSAENVAAMREQAREFDNLRGVTSNAAAEALAEVASSGRIPLDVMDKVTEAALKMQAATGKAVNDTASEFAEMARDPLQAVLRFNEAEGFLTRSVLDQIEALQDQGRYAEAARLAMDTRADALIERSDAVTEHLGLISGAMYEIRHGVPEIWDWLVDGMDRVDVKAKESVDTLSAWFRNFSVGGVAGVFGMQQSLFPAAMPLPDDKPESPVDSIAAKKFKAFQDQNLSREERHKREIQQIKETGKAAKASQKEIDDAVKAAEARYNESAKGLRGLDDALTGAGLQVFKDALKERQNALKNATDVMNALHSAGVMSDEAYYARSRELLQQDTAAQEDSLTKQIAFLRQRNVTGKDAVNVQKELGKLEAELATVRADAATELQVLAIREAQQAKARKEATEDYKIALDKSNAALALQVNAQIAAIGMGQREAEQVEQLAEVYNDLADELARLALLKERDPVNAADYDADIAEAKRAADAKLAILKDGFDRAAAARGEWINGAASAWKDWADDTSNVAQQVGSITGNFLDGVASSITNLFAKGKADAREFLADIATQLTEFFAKQAVMRFGMMFLGSVLGSGASQAGAQAFGNNTGWLTNGSFGGNGGAGFTLNAKGGVYDSLGDYRNQVVDKPTLFAFAKGVGLMGEAGKEAIMPLKAGPDGTLGVRAYGGGTAGDVAVYVNTTINSDGSSETSTRSTGVEADALKQFSDRMAQAAQAEIQKSMRPGGTLWRAGVTLK